MPDVPTDELLREAKRRLSAIEPAFVFREISEAGLNSLEAPGPSDRGLTHELATARAYAAFVRGRGERLVYASRYRGAFVPVFDGFVTDAFGVPIRNVSLKFDSLRRAVATEGKLLKSLARRLDLAKDLRTATSLTRWLAAVNAWPPACGGVRSVGDLAKDLDRALCLWVTFGLREGHIAQPLTLVVDLRESGFDLDFVSSAPCRARIRAMVSQVRLTLLWDHVRALEF